MTIKKDEAFQQILSEFETLANKVLEQLDILEKVVSSNGEKLPEELLKQVENNEAQIDKLEVKLSDRIVNTIVLYQPMASDIRKLIASYRIVISLERISDLTVNIIHFKQKIKIDEVYGRLAEVIGNMVVQSSNMVRKALLAFTLEDREYAIWTIKNDVVVDEMNQKMLKKAITKDDPAGSNKNLLMSFITIKEMMSNIERIADHATNIAEAAIYALEGKDLRHHKLPEQE